ncbi:MAG: ThuA domain-containing protein, partial [Steroidobacteraceae bacterium]|nr:ThuA domain-containing protein [Steroidobacteraceae bacterium]MDW8258028.1 ThuA domain-containing protein [Gammaproteobacteria bacterium]
RAAFRAWVERGGGFIGLHASGGDPVYFWDWYADELIGARFVGHPMEPQLQAARLVVENPADPLTAGLGTEWFMTDEWYSFASSPRASGSRILITADESSYRPIGLGGVDLRMGDHPLVWTRCVGTGRSFYMAIGHRPEVYADPRIALLLERALAWAAGIDTSHCRDRQPVAAAVPEQVARAAPPARPPLSLAPPEPLLRPAEPDAIALYERPFSAADAPQDDEQWEHFLGQRIIRNVRWPVLLPVRPPAGMANGAAVIVAPGGGYQFISIDNEGLPVARRLAEQGYTAFVLKYRTEATPRSPAEFLEAIRPRFGELGKKPLPDHWPAVADLAAAFARVRELAPTWQLDRSRVGVIGFSAGARAAIRLLEGPANDDVPSHIALIYPPMNQPVRAPRRPPLFLAIAADDPLFVHGKLALLDDWLTASTDVELHLYSQGGHGFGLRTQGTTSDRWFDQYLAWLGRRR